MAIGWKTYLCAVIMGFAGAAKALGWIDEAAYSLIIGVFGPAGLAALRAGIAKSGVGGGRD